MKTAISNIVVERRQPVYQEISSIKIPYFDAVVEGILRIGGTAATHAPVTLVDTQLLGTFLPKGTDIFFMTTGQSFISKPKHMDENLRSQSSRDS